ncbi:hypothetical protein B0J13DRAFT_631541 [Dactylonectria estremocensis]|uniref:3-beta hydroxysteroid dehydrogenase/isomerase domain-containing protein n=1 Tax=Dactylonectria estremocensis TaxID=1079267 RepID=A0A9P9D2L6_9HYPO|nr:hypothetical protein B0J13DRAFT_631541 [Dactylonectria estremocensis]
MSKSLVTGGTDFIALYVVTLLLEHGHHVNATDCVEPALQGTKNVLQCANDVESVKRVVLTSSVAAMYGDNADVLQVKYQILSESYWNETSSVSYAPYEMEIARTTPPYRRHLIK